MMSFSGWPSENVLPDKFQIHWTYVKEPDKFSKTEGAIYIWIEELDEYNIPFGIPRSYKLPYTPPLEEEILDVQSNLEAGEAQSATVKKLDKDVSIIYRNYSSNINKNLIIRIRNICRNNKRKFFLSNNYELAFKLDLDGVYLPSFNKSLLHNNYPKKKKFLVLGSAHNFKEIHQKKIYID